MLILTYIPSAYFCDADSGRIDMCDRLKVLGFHFSNKPGVGAHVEMIRKKFRIRFWSLRHLRSWGFTPEELVRVYTTYIRSVADYASVVYHSMLTDRQDKELERLQCHALKCIYGTGISGRRMRAMAGLPTLRERRIAMTDKFANKCAASDRFSG